MASPLRGWVNRVKAVAKHRTHQLAQGRSSAFGAAFRGRTAALPLDSSATSISATMLASSFRSSTLAGSSVCRSSVVARAPLVIEAAHKKGAGSTKNGRDSESKRRGVKVFGGQPVKAGGIIIRQCGSTWHAGTNVGCGKDFTLFSTIDGIVLYSKKKDKSMIHVFPAEHEKSRAAIEATHTRKPKDGVASRKERRRAMYKPRSQQREEAAATVAVVAAQVQP